MHAVDGAIVPGERAGLREGRLAQVAREGSQVHVPPVVHDQACALHEDAVAAWMLADKVGH